MALQQNYIHNGLHYEKRATNKNTKLIKSLSSTVTAKQS